MVGGRGLRDRALRLYLPLGFFLIVMLFPHGIGGVLERWPWPRPK